MSFFVSKFPGYLLGGVLAVGDPPIARVGGTTTPDCARSRYRGRVTQAPLCGNLSLFFFASTSADSGCPTLISGVGIYCGARSHLEDWLWGSETAFWREGQPMGTGKNRAILHSVGRKSRLFGMVAMWGTKNSGACVVHNNLTAASAFSRESKSGITYRFWASRGGSSRPQITPQTSQFIDVEFLKFFTPWLGRWPRKHRRHTTGRNTIHETSPRWPPYHAIKNRGLLINKTHTY